MAITSPISLLTPLPAGLSVTVTQGPGGATSHSGDLYYGWDFAASGMFGKSVLAVADGVVEFVKQDVPDGGAYQDLPGPGETRDPSLGPPGALGNVVTLRHSVDGQTFYSSYFHLGEDSVPVSVGESVMAGQQIGKVGNTGVRFGTHLHVNIGETFGPYRDATGTFPAYQIAQGPADGDRLLPLIDFVAAPADSESLLQVEGGFTNLMTFIAVENVTASRQIAPERSLRAFLEELGSQSASNFVTDAEAKYAGLDSIFVEDSNDLPLLDRLPLISDWFSRSLRAFPKSG